MEQQKAWPYFFFGLGLGVAAGVLFASKSGSETREFLRSRAEAGMDFARLRAEELRDSASDSMDRGRDLMRRRRDNLSAAVDAGRRAYRDAATLPGETIPPAKDPANE